MIIALAAAAVISWTDTPAPAGDLEFVMHRVGSFRSEACGVGDFNGDGRPDIVAGEFLYLAPDWKAVKIRSIQGQIDDQGNGYLYDFMNAPLDVDGDGLLDVVSVSWHEKLSHWFRNPGAAGGEWAESLVEKNGNFECGALWDIDGDGKALEILPDVKRTVWYELVKTADGTQGFAVHVVSEKEMPFGGGVGDVNGDGRADILRPAGWYEAPADPRTGTWIEHPLAVGGKEEGKADHTPQIQVYDVNADGLADIVTSLAHGYGIFWYEQGRQGSETTWQRHVIDDSWSQAHSITLADLDADGDLDLATGKRYKAHNGNDPGGLEPIGVYWYELDRGPQPKWTRHVISLGEGVGAGLELPAIDMDGDGDLDLVVTGKWAGPVWFENKMK
jgi:hypothetical protein